MKLCDLPDDFTSEQFMQLDKESLDSIPYEQKKWQCQCKGCTNGTHVRDYSLSPFFFLDRNSKYCREHPEEYWNNLNFRYWLCGKHRKMFDRLEKMYGNEKTYLKLCDISRMRLDMLISVK